MKLIRFWTKYGYQVIGGRFDFVRSPSIEEEINAPIEEVSSEIVKKSELEHEEAIRNHRRSWNLE